MFASKVALELKAIRSLIKLSFEILYIDPTTLGEEFIYYTAHFQYRPNLTSLHFKHVSACLDGIPDRCPVFKVLAGPC